VVCYFFFQLYESDLIKKIKNDVNVKLYCRCRHLQ